MSAPSIARANETPETAPAARQPLRVLVVEDNPDDVALIVRLLRRGGYEPEWLQVQTAAALSEALSRGGWDLVLSDYTMPQFDAMGALKSVREQSAHLPLIVISGSIGEETAVAAMRAGASDYLMKTNLARLVPAIERELREAACRRERARTNQALLDRLADERERLAVTLRSMGEGVITTDGSGVIVLFNAAAEQLTGWRQAQAVGRDMCEIIELLDGADEPVCEDYVERVLRTGDHVELSQNISLRARDGRRRSVTVTATPIHGHEGRISGVVTIFRDTTNEQKLEEELQRASKLESVALVAGGIAHDFNNILTAILGHISLAKAAPAPPPVIATIEKACLYATDLTRQLLTFAKGATPNRKVESIAGIVRESVEFGLHGSRLRCAFDLPEDLHPVEVDGSQIHQVINNLAINAVQATPAGGDLFVSARNVTVSRIQAVGSLPPGKYVRIAIRDTGGGIPGEHLGRIFDPYFTTKTTGSGLGLATGYSIIKKHDGLIQVESEPGKGTTFSIYLPASDKKPMKPAAEESGPAVQAPVGRGRILFMDDEEVLQELVAAMLGYLGYEVVCAANGEEALDVFKRAQAADKPFSAVMVDLTVPGGMGGYETMQRLRAMDPAVKVIVSSGYSNDPIMAEYRAHGFVGVIAKPYQLEELGRAVQKAMESRP